ncbi:MAG: metallophosphoesterase [Clostridia bacterium]|nr:metallophosphoesterase [Clostridia bacterium]
MKLFLFWALAFVGVQCVLTFVQFRLRKKHVKKSVRAILIAAKALTAVACGVLVLAGPVFFRPVQPLMVIVYAVLLPDAAAEIVYCIYLAVRKRTRKFAAVKALSLCFGVLFFVYGTVNMEIIRPDEHIYTSPKLTQAHKIIFVADMHVGSAQNMYTTENMIAAIRDEKPDAVILGGDITDDYTEKEELETTYRLFGEIGAPVYFVFGNHEVVQHEKYMKDGLHYTEAELIETMRKNGIIVLADEYALLADDLLLLGREDAAVPALRKAIGDLPNPDPEKYLIVADHQPTLAKDNLAAGTDLQLSGHTHGGQLFPNGMFLSLFSFTRGDYKLGDGQTLLVSPGACGWRVPFRTESHCRYEVILLEPAE